MNPLDAFKSEIDQIGAKVEKDVKIALYRELSRLFLSRLAELDADRRDVYVSALTSIGD